MLLPIPAPGLLHRLKVCLEVADRKLSWRVLQLFLPVFAVFALTTTLFTPPWTQAFEGELKPEDPPKPLPETVSADALPTAQINGVVWDQTVVGDTVYAVGEFSAARPAGSPAGQNEVRRANALAYDINTGELKNWAPSTNGRINAVEASADGTTIYLGGNITSLNGENTWRVGAVDATIGERIYLPVAAGGAVRDLDVSADGTTLYMAGAFAQVNNLRRLRVASVDLTTQRITHFAPQVDEGTVRAITAFPDGSAVAIGGDFTSVNGQRREGLALLNANATLREAEGNNIVRSGGLHNAVMNLASDERGFYAVAYSLSGHFEGMVQADWADGKIEVMSDCHGDSYDVHPAGDVVYVASHAHDCSTIGAFPEQYRYWHALAYSRDPVGEIAPTKVHPYATFEGQPAAAFLHFYPTFTIGNYTGISQATWTVEGNDKYIVYGGEFLAVNGRPQQGLVRFARRDIAPNQEGPMDKGGAYSASATSPEPGVVQLTIPANRDRDDQNLTYAVYRDPKGINDLEALKSQQPIWTTQWDLPFWQTSSVQVRDAGLEPGASHNYVVVVWDAHGAWTRSEVMRVEVVSQAQAEQHQSESQEES